MPNNLRFSQLLACSALACSLVVGCKSKPAETPEPTPEPAPTVLEQHPEKTPEKAAIQVSPRIAELCGIAEEQTYFAYNSSAVSSGARDVLKKLATCFTSGPLAGKSMLLVGHADPRGDDEYNLVLAGRRADNVAKGIADAGLAQSQMETSSRGAMDASGMDEAGWAKDRRVDVLLSGEGQ